MKPKVFFSLFVFFILSRATCAYAHTNFSARVNIQGQSDSSNVVEILSHSYYVSMGYSYVVGEVQNTGNQNLEYIELTVTFYDASNNVISTSFTFIGLDILKPNEKAPFELTSFPDENLAVDHYRVAVADHSVTSAHPYRELEIKGETAGTEFGYYTIQGEVENTGPVDATFVQVIATYYDSGGIVIGTSFTFTNPEDINSGSTAPFEITSFPLEITPASYSLIVGCIETVSEPEPEPEPSVEIQGQSESSNVVEILSHSYYVSMGYSYVVGEVQNIGSQNLEYIELTVTFYDASNNVISTSFTFSGLDILKSDEKAPFELHFLMRICPWIITKWL